MMPNVPEKLKIEDCKLRCARACFAVLTNHAEEAYPTKGPLQFAGERRDFIEAVLDLLMEEA